MEPVFTTSMVNIEVLGIIVQLIFLECILSIDNAAVMGAMVSHLPDDQPTPWSPRLRNLFGWTDALLGPQRSAALKVGLFGAYAGRILMLVLATVIMKLTWMHVLGACYLLHLGIQHFVAAYGRGQENDGTDDVTVAQRSFWGVVVALNLADMAFSLDNVVAAVALSQQLWIVIFGVGIGILIIRFAATIFTRMITWEPKLESGAYLLLIAIGTELLLDKVFNIHADDAVKFMVSVTILMLTVVCARVQKVRSLLVVFVPMLEMLALIGRGTTSAVGSTVGFVRKTALHH